MKSVEVVAEELEMLAANVLTSVHSIDVQLLSTSQKSADPVSRMTFYISSHVYGDHSSLGQLPLHKNCRCQEWDKYTQRFGQVCRHV